jgi:nitrogenase molybdenum-cofactor synthesis protein NifE
MLELVRQFAMTLESPVWDAVRKPAPWISEMTAAGQPMVVNG